MRILVDPTSGAVIGAGKDLVTGYAQPAQRMRGVVLSNPPSTTRKKPKVNTEHGHDPERPGGLLNGRKP
jgi:hypothetical protein